MQKNLMFKNVPRVLLLAASIGLIGCGATRTIKPLGEGNSQMSLSLGGPIVSEGFVAPVPYSVLGYDYGISDWINVNVSWHPTAAVYKTFAGEVGATVELVKQNGPIPEVVLDSRLAFGSDGANGVVFPILSPVISYEVGQWSPYLGMDHVFQLHKNDRIWSPQVFAPFAGVRLRNVDETLHFGGEFKWAAINHNFKFNKIDHPKAFGTNYGAYATYLYVSYAFK